MVKQPKASRHAHPRKTYSKKFNLLRPGTGIRFVPPGEWQRPKKGIAAPLRLVLLMFLLGMSAAVYLNRPVSAPERRVAAVPAAPSPHIMKEETVISNAVPVIDFAGQARPPVSMPTAPIPAAPAAPLETGGIPAITQADPAPAAPRWRIRFGIFLSRDNANRHAQSLEKKGVVAAVEPALHPMTAFMLKAGPADNVTAWQKLKAAGTKLNVAPMVEVEGKYLLVGPIWLKDRALVAENTFRAAGVRTEIVEERKDREVFKVLSAPFETVESARGAIGDMKVNGIEGVIDE